MTPRAVTTVSQLTQALRDRRDELDVSHMTIDRLAGLSDGYTSKLLAPTPMKGFSEMSLAAVLGALGLGIARVEIVEDPEAIARMRGRWERRKRAPTTRRRTGAAQ